MSMATETRPWTLADLHRLPDDGNKYELVHGVLLVTPAPSDSHETIAARLSRIIDPYVAAHGLGLVYHPRAVVRVLPDVEVEPDLMVRQPKAGVENRWEEAPRPLLVVEIVSSSSRRRDFGIKRELFRELAIPEYWVVDGRERSITVFRSDGERAVVTDEMSWVPVQGAPPLVFAVAAVLG